MTADQNQIQLGIIALEKGFITSRQLGNIEMGDVVEFVDLLVFFKVIDMIQRICTPKMHVITQSIFWGVI